VYISNKPSAQTYHPAGDPAGRLQRRSDRGQAQERQAEGSQNVTNHSVPGNDRRRLVQRNSFAVRPPGGEADKASPDRYSQVPVHDARGLANRTSQAASAYRAIAGEGDGLQQQAVKGEVVREEASLRSQQAIAAYRSHQTLDERLHITDVLGIDDYA
jgi:hypothetical protein